GDEAGARNGAEDLSALRIDLMDLAIAMLPDPERAFGPGEPRASSGRCWDGGEHAAGRRIDLLDAIVGDLKQMLAVECGAGARRDIERARNRAARRIERVQPLAGGEPDVPAVEREPVHVVDAREGSVLADDVGRRSIHGIILLARQR